MTIPTPSDPAAVAVELEELRGTMEIGLALSLWRGHPHLNANVPRTALRGRTGDVLRRAGRRARQMPS
ncbi:hypothetical protein SLA_0500 [Streptomyces laurentii]|uniref:Uncharacterized protein n=1 Tax=Streptomyces laurentii TaxID=39478 RepID=A0A160NUG1_STRLU|nr:hypothetical protein SLA_0500 [Streptomyces laurentii]